MSKYLRELAVWLREKHATMKAREVEAIADRIEAKQITIGQHQAAAVRLYHEQFCRYINEHQLNKCAWDAELCVLKPFLRRFTADAIREIHEAGL